MCVAWDFLQEFLGDTCLAVSGSDLIWVFPILRELAVFSCTPYGLGATKDEVSDVDGVEFNYAVMEAYDAELVEYLKEDGISPN